MASFKENIPNKACDVLRLLRYWNLTYFTSDTSMSKIIFFRMYQALCIYHTNIGHPCFRIIRKALVGLGHVKK